MNSEEYIEVSIFPEPFSEEAAEIIEAALADLPYDAFVIGDNCLKAYIPKDLYDARMLKVVLEGMEWRTTFRAVLIPPANWNAAWESRFTPISVGRSVTVKSPQHKGLPRSRFNITLLPQMAFGTGHHQTTYMMMESMLEHEDAIRGHAVLDMGCGTGVLAILAAKMGASHVWGIDIDAVAARSAYDNVAINRLRRKVETYCGDASLLQMGKYDVILANIHRNIILQDLPTYVRSLRKGGLLLLSGFFDTDAAAILQGAQVQGLINYGQKESTAEDGSCWCCLAFQKPV